MYIACPDSHFIHVFRLSHKGRHAACDLGEIIFHIDSCQMHTGRTYYPNMCQQKSLRRFPFQQILKELESLLQLVRSTIRLDHRAVGDDAGHQACKG